MKKLECPRCGKLMEEVYKKHRRFLRCEFCGLESHKRGEYKFPLESLGIAEKATFEIPLAELGIVKKS